MKFKKVIMLLIGVFILSSSAPSGVKCESSTGITDWQALQLAIAMTESQFVPDAVGSSNDYGIYQITPIYVKEVNRLLKEERFLHEEAFDIKKSVEMFNIMQSFKNPSRELELAIYYHNKSPQYKKKVLENYQFVLRYEKLRSVLIEYEVLYSDINAL